ncbi:MAG TPA: hypothetical protein VJ859_04510 [Allosphingosinicella sp.]|nr:hypothetical protein [Allosphingosinicella sp.]
MGGSAIVAILVGVVAIWLFIKLLGIALKLVAILIGVGLALAAYFAVRKLIAGGSR